MKRSISMLFALIGCTVLFSGCGDRKDPADEIIGVSPVPIQGEKGGQEETENGSGEVPNRNQTGEDVPGLAGNTESKDPSGDTPGTVRNSPLGYSMSYDAGVFTLEDTGGVDRFVYNAAEKQDTQVYISVQAYPDMEAGVLAEGLVLQSGENGVGSEDTALGRDSTEAKRIYIEREGEQVTQTQLFYVVPSGEGSLLVEVGGYTGMPTELEKKIEAALETFFLRAE